MLKFGLLAAILLLITACVSTPEFDKASGVTPKTIVDTIECELIAARNKIEERRRRGLARQSLCDYVVVADLSLQVDEQFTLAPSFTHTNVISKTFTRAFDWGVKLDTQAQRTFSQSVTFDVRKLELNKFDRCDRPAGGVSLNGSLGIAEVVEMGFTTIDPVDIGIATSDTVGSAVRDVGCPASMSTRPPQIFYSQKKGGGGGAGGDSKKKNTFSTQIEFVLLRNLSSTGPTFTLEHFKGPGRLLTTQRTDTHSVTIGFARADDPKGGQEAAKEQNDSAKIDSLRSNLRLLQRAN